MRPFHRGCDDRRMCTQAGCDVVRTEARGLCKKHYEAWRRKHPDQTREYGTPGCVECGGRHVAGGLCAKHYAQLRRGQFGQPPGNQGVRHHSAKLNPNVIREIRDLREKGGSLNEISARYGVSQASVSRIVNRQSWAHVT